MWSGPHVLLFTSGHGTGLRVRRLEFRSQTAVVCDTTAYLPAELVAERGIEMISLYVSIDGRAGARVGDL